MTRSFIPAIALASLHLVACQPSVRAEREGPPPAVQRVRTAGVPITASVRVVFLGDSIARGTGDETGLGFDGILSEAMKQRGIEVTNAVNFALDGARTVHLLRQLALDRVQRSVGNADIVVISVGANDLFVDSSRARRDQSRPDAQQIAESVLSRLDEGIAQIHTLNPETKIFLIGLYNPFFESSFSPLAASFIQQWNARLIAKYQDNPRVTVVQTFDLLNEPERLSFDRFHPSAEGYQLIAQRIAEATIVER